MLSRLTNLFTVVKMIPRPLLPVVQPWRQFVTRTRKSDCKIEQGKQRKGEEEPPKPEYEQEEQPKHERPTAEGERKEPEMRKEEQEPEPSEEIPSMPERPSSRRQTKPKPKRRHEEE